MTFLEALGIGLGVGLVHTAMLMIGSNANKKGNDESLKLMRERNELDRHKVSALHELQMRNLPTEYDVEQWLLDLPWSEDSSDDEKTLVAGNVRHFFGWIKNRRAI